MEKTWEIKEQELRKEIVNDVIAFLNANDVYDDNQLTEVIMGN